MIGQEYLLLVYTFDVRMNAYKLILILLIKIMRLSQALSNLKAISPNYKSNIKFHKQQISLFNYFEEGKRFFTPKQLDNYIHYFIDESECIQLISKGTILYKMFQKADKAYFLLEGAVRLFSSRSDVQKGEIKNFHKKQSAQEKIQQLVNLIQIQQNYINSSIIEAFYSQKSNVLIYNKFHLVQPGEYFGFAQMLKMGMRPFLSLCLQDSILLTINRSAFEKKFKEYQWVKQNYLINLLSKNMQKSYLKELQSMLIYLTPYIIIKKCYHEEILYQQGDLVTDLYMINEGEFESYKTIQLNIPKEHQQKQLKLINNKRLEIKISIALSGQFMGQQDIVINNKKRMFGLKSKNENSEVLKIESNMFLKLLNQRYDILKVISRKAKQKIQINKEKFDQSQLKVKQGFDQQFKKYQNKQKDKMIQKIMKEDKITHQQIDVIRHQDSGAVYRDTFEKMYKITNDQNTINVFDNGNTPKKFKGKQQSTIKGTAQNLNVKSPQKLTKKAIEHEYDIEQKLLFSNRKDLNKGQLINHYLTNQAFNQQILAEQNRINKNIPNNLQSRNRLKVDQKALKRVMIKFGTYKKIISEKSKPFKVGTIFNDQFNDVVSSSVIRKAKVDKKIQPEKLKQYIVSTYHDVINNYKPVLDNFSQTKLFQSWTLKDMKKDINQLKSKSEKRINSAKSQNSNKKSETSHKTLRSQFDCVLAPSNIRRSGRLSQLLQEADPNQQKQRYLNSNSSSRKGKLVLLNHMMKPTIYNI